MDISLLTSSLSSAIELAGLLFQERDRQKAAAIQIDLTEKLIQAQTQVTQVLAAIIEKDGRLHALTDTVRELQRHQSERSRYELAKLGVVGDFFAYRLRPASELDERANEPAHFLCQPCFDADKKSVLQVGKFMAICPLCKVQTRVNKADTSALAVRNAGGINRNW